MMGRGSISTTHGQSRILKHPTPDILTYIQKAVKTGVYRTTEEIEFMNQELKENSSDLRRIRWNVRRGSKITDYPKEYEILSLNPPSPFKPKISLKDKKKVYSRYLKTHRPTDLLAQKYLNMRGQIARNKNGGETTLTANEYYQRLLGSNKIPKVDSAMASKSASVRKAYAVAVKQYEIMRAGNLSEKKAMEQVEQLLMSGDFNEKASSRAKAESLHKAISSMKVGDATVRGEKAFEGAKPKEKILNENKEDPDNYSSDYGTKVSILYSENQRAFEGMIIWTRRLQAVPYKKWTVGASVALDHWIAKRVLGLSEETWLALIEGDSPELLGRGRDIVVTRHALFPETIKKESTIHQNIDIDDTDDDLEALLATLGGIASPGNTEKKSTEEEPNKSSPTDELEIKLQFWRRKQAKHEYEDWPSQDKGEFMTWLEESFISTQVPESALASVDLEETRKNILQAAPLNADDENKFWNSICDETSAELFLQSLYAKDVNKSRHPFWSLDYKSQLERLVNLGSIGELANEYSTEADRSKFLTQYGHYILEGMQFDHLLPDPSGPIFGSDLGFHLQEKYSIDSGDRFRLKKISYGNENFDSSSLCYARMIYKEWNKLKVGRAHYEEKLYKKGLLGLTYEQSQK